MATLVISVGGTTLPDNVTSLKRSDELLWSEGTGRSASDGQMVGSVVAGKQTWEVEWGPLTAAQYATVRSAVGGGFMALSITLNGASVASCTVYRGSIAGELMGVFGGVAYYTGVAVQLIER